MPLPLWDRRRARDRQLRDELMRAVAELTVFTTKLRLEIDDDGGGSDDTPPKPERS